MGKSVNLRQNLVLFKFILKYIGLSDISELKNKLEKVDNGFDTDGKSYYFHELKNLNLNIDEEKLKEYDNNITVYLEHINELRTKKINLKYFQYIAILLTEIFFDNYKKEDFINNFNKFSRGIFEKDISKIAYWMATGSGKTLIMHINYFQFHKYHQKPLDNIILITPNQNMSRQHLEEFRKSNIPAKIFNGSIPQSEMIQILDIHKLTEKKTDNAITVEINSFEGNNLVFVDEGHKGLKKVNTWKHYRDKISEIGFTFEYSATFDEVITSKNDKLLKEYSKAIIFDYSYKYFYQDGFGKEFMVLNLRDGEYSDHNKETIILFNLLSFYQQAKYFKDNKENLKPFNFEKPLWIFVGNLVNTGKSQIDKEVLSDLGYILNFLNRFLTLKERYVSNINKILNDEIHLIEKDGDISFNRHFTYIKNLEMDGKAIYEDIIKIVFNSNTNQHLEIRILSNSPGEIALRVSNAKEDFGLMNIGDVNSFKKSITRDNLNILEDRFTDSLFNKLNDKNSSINILLGSRKFMEGWDSFRVSNMGLLNIGTNKGPQIIQLFGRGVRLKGYKEYMKRSNVLIQENVLDKENVVSNIDILETLNIFGIKADYIKKFREALEDEGIPEKELITLKIRKNKEFINENLITLKVKENLSFSDPLILKYNPQLPSIRIDLRPRIDSIESSPDILKRTQNEGKIFSLQNYLDYVNWDNIFFNTYKFKQQNGFYNIYFDKKSLMQILYDIDYEIIHDPDFEINNFSQIEFIESLCTTILFKYIKNFYNTYKRKWATDNIEYSTLSEDDEGFKDYMISIDKEKKVLINKINDLIENGKIFNDNIEDISIFFDQHLYQPLIIKNEILDTTPIGLNEGEKRFIEELKQYFLINKNEAKIKEYKFYIFRNLSKKGLGFFTETNNFYPDFILWAVNKKCQKISFIDPKGLIYNMEENISKIELNNTLKDIQEKLGRKNVKLSSFILVVPTTPFEKIKKSLNVEKREELESKNVLFQIDNKYIDKLISKIIAE